MIMDIKNILIDYFINIVYDHNNIIHYQIVYSSTGHYTKNYYQLKYESCFK